MLPLLNMLISGSTGREKITRDRHQAEAVRSVYRNAAKTILTFEVSKASVYVWFA